MRFYAFNPLAGGILSGKYKFDQAATTGRYAQGTVMGSRYRLVRLPAQSGVMFGLFFVFCSS